MSKRVRFIMIGGFLGAGKTTTIARLARTYQQQGKRVALVTNDQAQDLVDTNSLRSQGFAVEEVPGACFCCRFDDLVGRVRLLEERERPDVVLAEPVGSCTDLVATVIQPLKDLYRAQFSIAPYVVLFKPSHGLRILRNEPDAGFSPKAAYIFRKQLEEADAIALNRIDELSAADQDELTALVGQMHPGTPLLRVSARTGQGFDGLMQILEQDGAFGQRILDIDYDIYAEGEAEMGWLNASAHVEFTAPQELDGFLLEVIRKLGGVFRRHGAEVAHLKVIGLGDGTFAVANLVSNATDVELSVASRQQVRSVDLIVNARVAIDPTLLDTEVQRVVADCCATIQAQAQFQKSQSLRPGRPTPTHRYRQPVGV